MQFAFTSGYAQETQEDKTLAPYFVVQGDPNVDHLPLKDTRVEITVAGVIADVKVRQIYRNEGSRPINASYVFPASTRAAVYAMRMQIGNEIIVAKIKEREQAKKDFEQAKEEGKSASLLEQQRPNVFSMSLANVMPQEQVEIELRYTELLVPTDNVYEVVFPTVVGPRYASADRTEARTKTASSTLLIYIRVKKPTSALHISTKIFAGVPIYDLSCPSHQIHPQWQNQRRCAVDARRFGSFPGKSRLCTALSSRRRADRLRFAALPGSRMKTSFSTWPNRRQRVATEAIPPREYIFVVDVSGSMEGFPLNTSKRLLKRSDWTTCARRICSMWCCLPATRLCFRRNHLQANQQNIASAIRLLEQQRGGGGTELLPAIQASDESAATGRHLAQRRAGH